MNNFNYLKIDYFYAIHLILILIIFGFLSTLILDFLSKIIPFLESESLLQILRYIFPFLLLFRYVFKKHKKSIQWSIISCRTLRWDIYISTFFLMIFIIVLSEYIVDLLPKEGLFLGPFYRWFNENLIEESRHLVPFFISAVVLAPFCEEFFFRGILLDSLLRNNISYVKAILFSSFLFGVAHINPWQFISAFLIGNLIGLIYFRTHSILLCILLHALNNGISFFLRLIDKEEKIFHWIHSHIFTVWMGLIFFIIILYLFFFQTRSSYSYWSLPHE